MSDADSNAILSRYREHVEALTEVFPESIRQLANHISLHDGLIRRACYEPSSHTLVLALRCGDLQNGYSDVDIRYSGTSLGSHDLEQLRELAPDLDVEILYDELDAGDVGYIHRLLFWPRGEIEIVFRDLTMDIAPRADREIIREGFAEGPP